MTVTTFAILEVVGDGTKKKQKHKNQGVKLK